jgi:hypothetical protein
MKAKSAAGKMQLSPSSDCSFLGLDLEVLILVLTI